MGGGGGGGGGGVEEEVLMHWHFLVACNCACTAVVIHNNIA